MWPYYKGYTAADTGPRMRVGASLMMERGQKVPASEVLEDEERLINPEGVGPTTPYTPPSSPYSRKTEKASVCSAGPTGLLQRVHGPIMCRQTKAEAAGSGCVQSCGMAEPERHRHHPQKQNMSQKPAGYDKQR
ncbi:unnamed protein product [Pleuronectes platessa]|uniref:Uncharacterized protein n=1 Tax=Pleuronectes platessa TaxID=8262 RepID=A0A9N7VHZ5_PLEPL|nr:unnamed protein product [Pleuronectes platessa]